MAQPLQHYQAGHYAEAQRLGKQALDLCEARFGREHPNCAWTLNNLANVYKDQGKYAQAEELYQRALAIQEKALGAGHPDVATTLNNLQFSIGFLKETHEDLGFSVP